MPTPEDVARSFFDALGKRDLEAAMALWAPDCVDDFVAIREVRGSGEIRRFFEELFAAFPDFQMSAGRVVADGEAAVVQWTASGTFSGGPFIGIDPTGRPVEIRGVDVMEVTDGLIRHTTVYYDGAAFARQIGMLPRSESSGERAMVSVFNTATHLRSRLKARMERTGAHG